MKMENEEKLILENQSAQIHIDLYKHFLKVSFSPQKTLDGATFGIIFDIEQQVLDTCGNDTF